MDTGVAVSVGSAVIALGALAVSAQQARIASRQTRLQQRMHEDASQPYLWADLRPDEGSAGLLQLIVTNSGPTAAEDVSITIEPPLPQEWRGPWQSVGPAGPIASLPPGRRMLWNLGTMVARTEPGQQTRFIITLLGRGPHGPVRTSYAVDVEDYRTTAAMPAGTLRTIATSIDKLTKQLEK